jgi:hypothetical protein
VKTNLVDKKCISTEWFTPPEILEPVRELFGGEIGFDPCTIDRNPTLAERFATKEHDGLAMDWFAWWVACGKPSPTFFVNPPYGKVLYDWIEKVEHAASIGFKVVLLVSASSRWDQEKWQKIYSPELTAFCMPRGRVKFLDENGVQQKSPPYPSLLYFYNIPLEDVHRCFDKVGKVVGQNCE